VCEGSCAVVRVVSPTVPVIVTVVVTGFKLLGKADEKAVVPPEPPPVPETTLKALSFWVVT